MTDASRARGKRAERIVASRLGGKRIKRQGEAAPDVEGAWFVAEVKNYKGAPRRPYDALRKLRLVAPSMTKLHIHVYKHPSWHEWLVCCLLSEFKEWYGLELPLAEEEEEEEEENASE